MGSARAEEARNASQVSDSKLLSPCSAGYCSSHARRAAKKGLWALKKYEHPGDYKKRMKLAEEGRAGEGGKVLSAAPRSSGVFGLIKRIFGAK